VVSRFVFCLSGLVGVVELPQLVEVLVAHQTAGLLDVEVDGPDLSAVSAVLLQF
jgi:hypothetical protein